MYRWTCGYRAVATAISRVSKEMLAELSGTASVLLFVARWLVKETAGHIRWEIRRDVLRLIDAAADATVDEDRRRERLKKTWWTARARHCQEEATAEGTRGGAEEGGGEEATAKGPAARTGPPCKGRKGGGALDNDRPLQDEAPEVEGQTGAPDGAR